MDSRLRLVTDLAPARWIREGIGHEEFTVDVLLPSGFQAYARVLHPAESDETDEVLRWREVAERSRKTVRPQTSWKDIRVPGVADPPVGEMDRTDLSALCKVLARWTESPRHCYFGLWKGVGWATDTGPSLRLEFREYLVYEGPLDAAMGVGEHSPDFFWAQSPHLWWPEDRAWCVATDVDLNSTYIGGSTGLVADLIDEPRLETVAAARTDPLS